MNATKENKAKLQIIISTLILTIVFIAELYLMTNYFLGMIIPIIVLGVVALTAVYIMVNAIMMISAEKEAQRQAHFDNLYKSEKASYIMLKNKFEEIEQKLAIIQETSKIPSEEIINAQKGIAKVIINRSKENADAIINSNDQVLERLDEIDETQNTKFTGMSKDQRLKLTEMSNQTELKLQDMVVQLKDMELRLNQAITQSGGSKVIAAAPDADEASEPLVEDLFSTELPMAEDDFGMENEIDLQEELPVEGENQMEDLLEDASAVEEALEPEIEEPVVEEVPPMPDLSDPNRALSPDEIAALIANL